MNLEKNQPASGKRRKSNRIVCALRGVFAAKPKFITRTVTFAYLGLAFSSVEEASASSPRDGGILVSSTSDLELTINRVKASHFLSQATYGATWDQITRMARDIGRRGEDEAFRRWINVQVNLPATLVDEEMAQLVQDTGRPLPSDLDVITPGFQAPRVYRDYVVWDRVLTAPDQLRHRMADALSQILVVGTEDVLRNRNGWRGTSRYHDMLLSNAFGTYRNILSEMVYHPAMGVYLDSAGNQQTTINPITLLPRFPDENFAREFLQLFTVGVFRLNEGGEILNLAGNPLRGRRDIPDEIYNNQTIQEFARVFTGLNYTPRGPSDRSGFANRFFNFLEPMVMHNDFHSPGRKVLLEGFTTPDGPANGDRDISLAIDNAFMHDNCPPFISRLLIQRFTTSNPSTEYVRDVVAAFKSGGRGGRRGDLGAVISAILMHPEARNSLEISVQDLPGGLHRVRVIPRDRLHGKLKEPFIQFASFLRAFDIQSTDEDVPGTFRYNSITGKLGQFPLDSDSVFNFYLPDYQPVGRVQRNDIVAPEFQILTPSNLHNYANHIEGTMRTTGSTPNHRRLGFPGATAGRSEMDFEPIFSRLDDPDELLNYLNIVFCQGTMSAETAQVYRDEILDTSLADDVKARILLTTLLLSPDCAVTN